MQKLNAGQFDAAMALLELQAGYAELADIELGHVAIGPKKTPSYTLGIDAYNNLALANLRKKDYLMARLWCRASLRWDTENKTALARLREAEQQLAVWKWPKHVSGIYLQYAGRGQWESLVVRNVRPDHISVSFSGMRMGNDPEGTPAALGEFEATLRLSQNRATYRGEPDQPCEVRMAFSPDQVTLTQSGDCGFGYGVEASGVFNRVSAK